MLDSLVSSLLQEGLSEEQLVKAELKLGVPRTHIIRFVNESDPTINKKYDTWILKQWMFLNVRLPEDSDRVREVLNHFIEQSRKQNSPIESNIFKYRTIHDLERALEEVVPGMKASSQEANLNGMEGVLVIKKDGPYTLLRVSDEESLKDLGEGTKWCTRRSYRRCYADRYLRQYGHLFIVLKNNKPFMQYTPNFDQIMDVDDQPVSGVFDEKLQDILEPINPDADTAIDYAEKVLQGRYREGEKAILGSPYLIHHYVLYVIKKRWPEGERALLREGDPKSLYEYATGVINGRWPEAEPFIAESPYYSYYYCFDLDYALIADRPEKAPELLEKAIVRDPKYAVKYARDVIRGRWPFGEPYIAKDPKAAVGYARQVVKKPWPEGEEAIARDGQCSLDYAVYIIKGRWPPGEKAIAKNADRSMEYAQDILSSEEPLDGPPLPSGIRVFVRGNNQGPE